MGLFDFLSKKESSDTPGSSPAEPQNIEFLHKADVEMVLVKVSINRQDALLVKMYKDGTIVRAGMAALPTVEVSTLSQVANPAENWAAFLQTIPEQLLEHNERHVAADIKKPFSYTVAFYGDSANGETGEQAQWQHSQGIEIEGNLEGPYHALHGLLEQVVVSAMRFTNSYFLDVLVLACWDLKARGMAEGMVSMGKNAHKETTWNDFLMHLLQSPLASEIGSYTAGKVYEDACNGQAFKLEIQTNAGRARYDFVPVK